MDDLRLAARNDQETAQSLLVDDRHYLGAVARLGDHSEVVAGADITESRGVKLVAKGTPIDSRVLDKLLGHRLREPIDAHLTVADGVTPDALAGAAATLIDTEAWWARAADRSGDPLGVRHGLARLKLPEPLCFRLTVARDQRPRLYRHSLRVAVLAHCLATRLALSSGDTDRLLVAALCHDFGELHTDPEMLDPAHRITDEERRFVYVHPLTGFLILRGIPGVDLQVARAVIQHHERLDGSGYPSGLRGEAISPLARLLTVADVAESVMNRFSDHRRLSIMLRLNSQRYDARAVSLLLDLAAADSVPAAAAAPQVPDALHRQLAGAQAVLAGWSDIRRLRSTGPEKQEGDALSFLCDRISGINSTLRQFGFDPDSFAELISLAEGDEEVGTEIKAVLDETHFQFREMFREIERRQASGTFSLPSDQQPLFDQWQTQLKAAAEET